MNVLLGKLTRLEKDVQACWEYFVTSKIKEGMELINKIFYSIETIINEIEKNNIIKIDINKVQNIFIRLETALKLPDYVLIADLLNYEIKPLIELWRLNINDL